MLIKEKKTKSYFKFNITTSRFKKNISFKNLLLLIIAFQSFIILFFFIFFVPHWSGFYKVESEYNKQNFFVKKIQSLGYVSKSIISLSHPVIQLLASRTSPGVMSFS